MRGERKVKAYLSLGSNVGDRGGYLEQARALLSCSGKVKLIQASGMYETEPWGLAHQPEFLNQVIEIETHLTAPELLLFCQQIEIQLGRTRECLWGPRTIDIDILFYDNIICQDPDLVLPHPQIENREFVLAPLREIAPGFILPSGKSVMDIFGSGKVTRMNE